MPSSKVIFITFNFVVVRVEPRASYMLGMCSTIELYHLLPLLTSCVLAFFTSWSENDRSGLQLCESDSLWGPCLSS